MRIIVKCPNGHAIKASERYRGKKVKCPKCSATTLVVEQDVGLHAALADIDTATRELNIEGDGAERLNGPMVFTGDPWANDSCQTSALPTPYALPSQQNGLTQGLWRDGKKMVMDIHNRRFPQRCVKTNEPYDGIDREIEVSYVTGATKSFALSALSALAISLASPGTTTRLIFSKIQIEELRMCFPIQKEWLRNHERRRTYGFNTLIMTLGGAIALFVVYLFCLFVGVTDDQSKWLSYLIVFMLVASGAAALNVLRLGGPVARVTMKTQTHVWIAGLHPEFVRGLPEWNR